MSADSRFPHAWDANRALVAGGPTPSLDEVIFALEPMRRHSGARYRQVEVVDVDGHAALVAELRAACGQPSRFAVMLAGGDDVERPASIAVRVAERAAPTAMQWRRAKEASHSDEPLPDEVMQQLTERDVVVQFASGRRLFVAELDGVDAGFATYHSLRGAGLVDDVATQPAHRRRGVAAAIVRRIVSISRDAGDVALFLFASEDAPARRLYERLGFQSVAVSAQFHIDVTPRAS